MSTERKSATTQLLVRSEPAVVVGVLAGGLRTLGWRKRPRRGCPVVSVVMPVRNGGASFASAVQSVYAQTYDNVELIVVDGGSTDGTLAVLQAESERIDYWVSSRDRGIYDAINKGIACASGQLIAVLNADDGFEPGAVERAVEAVQAHDADFCVGSVIIRDSSGRRHLIAHPLKRWQAEGEHPTGRMPFPHISLIVTRAVYDRLGAYDSSYRVAADYDFALRLLRSGAKGVRVPDACGWVTQGGVSDSAVNLQEKRDILVRAGVSPVYARFIFASSMLKRRIAGALPERLLHAVLRLRRARVQPLPLS